MLNAETFGATGGETSGLPDISFFRNRYFDQRSGTWLTEDPIGVAGGANLYQYVGNNPISYSDPFDLCPPDDTNLDDCQTDSTGTRKPAY